MRNVLLIAGFIAGGAAALYFLDPDKGKKRRKKFKKDVDRVWNQAGKTVDQYSRELQPHLRKWSGEIADRAQHYSHELQPHLRRWSSRLSDKAQEYSHQVAGKAQEYSHEIGNRAAHQLNGHSQWAPSARLLGAAASGLAFYGAGRPGVTGILMRTISLGLFTRALLASR